MTHEDRVYDYMRRNGTITSLEAINELGVTRLAAKVFNLKKMGINVVGLRVDKKNRFGETVRVSEYHIEEG